MNRKQRKARNRTGKMTCPICLEKHILREHHLRGRKIPNPNHPSNLLYCCANCHDEIHEGKIIIEGWFNTTSGKEIFWHYANQESLTGSHIKTHIIGHSHNSQ